MRRCWIACCVALGLVGTTGCKMESVKNLFDSKTDTKVAKEVQAAAGDDLAMPSSGIAQKARRSIDEWAQRRELSKGLSAAMSQSQGYKEVKLEAAFGIGLGRLAADDRSAVVEIARSIDAYQGSVLDAFRAQIEMYMGGSKEEIDRWIDKSMARKNDDAYRSVVRVSPEYAPSAERSLNESKLAQYAERKKRIAEIERIVGPNIDLSAIDSLFQKDFHQAQEDLLYYARSLFAFSEYESIDERLATMQPDDIDRSARGLELLMILANRLNREANADVARRLKAALSSTDTANAYARFIAQQMPDKQSLIGAILTYGMRSADPGVCTMLRELGMSGEIGMSQAYDAELKCLASYFAQDPVDNLLDRCLTIDAQLTKLGEVFGSKPRSTPDGMQPTEDEYRQMKVMIESCHIYAFEQGYFYRSAMPIGKGDVDPDSFEMPMSTLTYAAFMNSGFDFYESIYQRDEADDEDGPKPSLSFKYQYRDDSRWLTLLTNAANLEDAIAQKYLAVHYLKDADGDRDQIEWGCYWAKRLEQNRECATFCPVYAVTKGMTKYCDMFCNIKDSKNGEDDIFRICESKS